MANVQKGMQENCIGCAFSKENRKKSGSSIVTQRSNGVLQGQVVAGANKICRYNRNGSTNYVTVKAHELCPLSSTDDAATEAAFVSPSGLVMTRGICMAFALPLMSFGSPR